MQYILKEDKLIKNYNNRVYVVEQLPQLLHGLNVALDEIGFNLLNSIEYNKVEKVGNSLKLSGNRCKIVTQQLIEVNYKQDYTQNIGVKIENLQKAIKFIDKDQFNPILTGVFVCNNGVMATNKLQAYCSCKKYENGITLDSEFVKALLSNVKDETTVNILFNSTNCCAILNNCEIYGAIMQGEYPDLTKLFVMFGEKFIFTKKEMLNYLTLGEKIGKNALVSFANSRITFKNTENELNFDLLPTYDSLQILLNIDFLKNAIINCDDDNVKLTYNGELKPLGVGENIIIMPIRRS